MIHKIHNVRNKNKPNNHLFSALVFCLTATILLCFSLVEVASAKDNPSQPVPITFDSEGSQIHGFFYPAKTNKPVPTVLILNGWPGSDKDPFGLGTRMMQEGINALDFNYRGTWASEGSNKITNSLEDVNSAVSFLLSEEVTNKFHIDTSNLFIVGYSYGGNMALIGSVNHPLIKNVVSIAGFDISYTARKIEKDEKLRTYWENIIDEVQSDSKMVRGLGSGKAAVEEWLSTMNQYDVVANAKKLARKDILLLGGWLDNQSTLEGHILPLYRALQKHKTKNLEIAMFNDNHNFKNMDVRNRLVNKIISWVKYKTTE
jgi:uncharacterized protein